MGVASDDAADWYVPSFPDGGDDADATSPPPPADAATLDARDGSSDAGLDGLCGPATCHNGCCNGYGQCIDPPTTAACGGRGSACQVCDAGPCGGGSCSVVQWTCGPSNCGGCCIGTQSYGDAAQTQCFAGTDGEFCGSGGVGCGICGPGKQCRALLFDAGGFCQANNGCDPSTCTGCCVGNVCAQGDQAIACGLGGAACKDCGDAGVCIDGNCACGGPMAPPCPDN